MLTLRLREIGAALPSQSVEQLVPTKPAETEGAWHDSTLELERGLDVVELPVDLVLPEPKRP